MDNAVKGPDDATPAVVAAERLAYRCWRGAGQLPPPSAGLRELAEGVRLRQRPRVSYEVPSFISRDVADLRRAVRG